jgi:glycogen synthase
MKESEILKILMLSWEFPPRCIGGLSTHVYYLSKELRHRGLEVHVITCREDNEPIYEEQEGIFVHRVSPYGIHTEEFTKWVMHLNFAMIEMVIGLITATGKFDIIHAHDWLTAFCARVLRRSYQIPMVSTIHATEYGRNNGLKSDMQKYISSVEGMLADESCKIVACSNYMRNEIIELFKPNWEDIWLIPNGIYEKSVQHKFDSINYRRNYALDHEKILFFVGRHVFEKGVNILIEALPKILNKYKDLKTVIAGKGPMTEPLRSRVFQLGLNNKVIFTGYISEEDKNRLYRVSDIAIFPSLYEPFGIVALEAMAAGCPVVVSSAGGLGEIVQHKYNGLKTTTGSVESIVDNVIELLNNNDLAMELRKNGYRSVIEDYSWDRSADLTTKMYDLVIEEAQF